jgi:hypothetical protein
MTIGHPVQGESSGRGRSLWPALLGVLAIPVIVPAQTTANNGDGNHSCQACVCNDAECTDKVCSTANCSSNEVCTSRTGTLNGRRWVVARCTHIPAQP